MTLIFSRLMQDFITFSTAGLVYDNAQQSGNATAISVAQQSLDSAIDQFRRNVALDASYLTYIGILFVSRKLNYLMFVLGLAMFVCTYVYMCAWVYTGEVNAKRIREKYFQAILRQDIAYSDKVGAGEVATRIETDTREPRVFVRFGLRSNKIDLIQQAISEKVAIVISSISSFFTGFAIAYARCWQLALAMSSILPCLVLTGAFMSKFVSKYTK